MNNVFYNYKSPDSFKDHLESNFNLPYTIHIKEKFATEHIFPLHYGETFEILFCDNLIGKMTIDNRTYLFKGQQIFIIPPNTIHSSVTKKSNGSMYVLKIFFKEISKFINIPEIFEYNGQNFSKLSFICSEKNKVFQLLFDLIKDDGNIFSCLSHILLIFNILQKNPSNFLKNRPNIYSFRNAELKEIIIWTQENFNKKITIDTIAKKAGYTKCYFCNKFKDITSMTYIDYLQNIRISHACFLLNQNIPIIKVSNSCGFENVSYFIQVFKKIQGCTPKSYTKNYCKY